MKKILKKYQDRIIVLKDNRRIDKTSGYPYDHEIKCTQEFIRDLKNLEKRNPPHECKCIPAPSGSSKCNKEVFKEPVCRNPKKKVRN